MTGIDDHRPRVAAMGGLQLLPATTGLLSVAFALPTDVNGGHERTRAVNDNLRRSMSVGDGRPRLPKDDS